MKMVQWVRSFKFLEALPTTIGRKNLASVDARQLSYCTDNQEIVLFKKI